MKASNTDTQTLADIGRIPAMISAFAIPPITPTAWARMSWYMVGSRTRLRGVKKLFGCWMYYPRFTLADARP